MNERTTLEIIAPTVEQALAQGLAQLGLPADAVSVEVLDSGNKGLFGLGGRQVRVRLTVNPPGGAPMPTPTAAPETRRGAMGRGERRGPFGRGGRPDRKQGPQPSAAAAATNEHRGVRPNERRAADGAPMPAPTTYVEQQKLMREPRRTNGKPRRDERVGRGPRPSGGPGGPRSRETEGSRFGRSAATTEPGLPIPVEEPLPPSNDPNLTGAETHEGHDALLDTAEATISKLLFHMGLQAQVSAHYGEMRDERRPILVDVRGTDLGILIGRRGENLASFQYLSALMVGKASGEFVRLVVDVEGHRDRRERQLRQLARRMAEQVLKTGRKLTLEPMPASERRIIHLELRDHPAVKTESTGEEPHRKITILPKE